jgi:hypothetical protein
LGGLGFDHPQTHREVRHRFASQAGSSRRPTAESGPTNLQGPQRHRRIIRTTKQWRGLATRYGKLAITYRAAAVLGACITCTRHMADTLSSQGKD